MLLPWHQNNLGINNKATTKRCGANQFYFVLACDIVVGTNTASLTTMMSHL